METWEAGFRTRLADFIYPEGRRRRITEAQERIAMQERVRCAYHILWSDAVGAEHYKKSDWIEFGTLLTSLGVTL
jgi:hypothetical protein